MKKEENFGITNVRREKKGIFDRNVQNKKFTQLDNEINLMLE
jgi:hypothetical protein